jgi:3D (Asp-Asp-Asp) domain-containing protein
MNGGKRLAFALTVLFVTGANAADAYTNTNTISVTNTLLASQKETAAVKKDPFIIDLPFGKTDEAEEAATDTEKTISREDKILNAWKAKQASKWASLPKGKFTVNASAYTASADECDNDLGITASGLLVKKNLTLACPPEFPFGAKVSIDGVGTLRCEDRGGAIKGNHFDIYVETKREAFAFGRRNLVAEVIFE